MAKKKVKLDAGHGGKDPGAVGHDLKEKDITLKVVKETKKYLEANYENIDVTLTRSDDRFVTLSDRAKDANMDKVDLFVSVHVNATTNPSAEGFETFIYLNSLSEKTRDAQNAIHNAVITNAPYFKDRGKQKKNLQVLRTTKMPGVLTEFGFITNKKDSDILKDNSKLLQIAKAQALGIANYLKLTKKQVKKEEKPKVETVSKPKEPILKVIRFTSPLMRGLEVETIQRILKLKVDGLYGKVTEATVKAFQKKHGLVADGIVGAKTWAVLFAKS